MNPRRLLWPVVASLLVGLWLGVSASQRILPIRPPNVQARSLEAAISFPGTVGNVNHFAGDPAIAAGADRLLAISNAEVVLFDKRGRIVARKGLHAFFLPAMVPGESSAGDVDAIYDPESQRFFVSEAAKIHPQVCQPGACVGHNMLAVSKSTSPGSLDTADWHIFAIDRYLHRPPGAVVETDIWGDFDKLGTAGDALVITSKQYHGPESVSVGDRVRILRKASLIAGEAPSSWVDHFDISRKGVTEYPGLMPVQSSEPVPAMYLISRQEPSNANRTEPACGIVVHRIENPLGVPTVMSRPVLLDGDCLRGWGGNRPGWVPQTAGSTPIHISPGPRTRAAYHDGRLFVVDTYMKSFGAASFAAVKWAELDVRRWPDTPTVVQQGIIAEEGSWFFYPSISVNSSGTVVMAFNNARQGSYLGVSAVTRSVGDPPGLTTAPALIKRGEAAVLRVDGAGWNRFADFTSLALDPTDATSWVHGEIGSSPMQTWISQIVSRE